MHHPIRLAEDYAMLDLLSGGRVNFGAGRGMSVAEYGVFEKEWANAQERLEEALTVIRLAWTEPTLEWEGAHYRYHGFTVRPKPSQRPHPPIYVPANKEPANFRMIARNGYNLMTLPWITGNAEQRTRIEWYLDELTASGHAREDHEVFVMYPVYVGDSDAGARQDVEDPWHRWREFALEELRMDPSRAAMLEQIKGRLSYEAMVEEHRGVFGGPASCVDHLRHIREVVGPDHVGLCFHFGGLSQAKVLGSMERFSRYVKPELG
jgi:alkanesulfonate monooxygenase SsuD/methylene tetrahydromethanopterin reductase-like flavin-dependent oxidoreductase (luciferase family)